MENTEMNGNELKEALDNKEVYFEVMDEDGINHRLLLLSIFEAGDLKRKYVAGMTADVVIYRYTPHLLPSGDYKHCIEEIGSDNELNEACALFDKYVEGGISTSEVKEMTLVMELPDDEGGTADIPITASVYKILELDRYNSQYVVCCPTNIMFYRYDEIEKDGQNFIEFSTIYSPQEYEDVADYFNQYLMNDEAGVENAN